MHPYCLYRMRIFWAFLTLFFVPKLYCQKTQNIWLFGLNKGIDFNYREPKLFTGSKLYFPYAITFSYAHPSVICDSKGNLRFYSDGYHIFNHLHDTIKKFRAMNIIYHTTLTTFNFIMQIHQLLTSLLTIQKLKPMALLYCLPT